MVDAAWLHAVPGGPLRGSDSEIVPDHSVYGPHHHPHTPGLGEISQSWPATQGEEQAAINSVRDAKHSVFSENESSSEIVRGG